MGTILSLIWVASIVCIWYFWRKKPNKKYLLTSVAVLMISTFLYSLTPEYRADSAKREAESASKASKKSKDTKASSATKVVEKSSSSKKDDVSDKQLLKRAKKLKYGMSYDEVKKIMATKPTTDERDESGYYTLQYNVSTVILGFDEKDKLNQGIKGAPQIAKQAQASAKKAKEESSNNRNTIAGFAQSFGQKPVEKLQRMSMVYTSERIGDNMYYIWDTGNKTVGKLVRVDDPQRFTTVYQYDENGQDGLLGKQLYSGRTIMNNPQKVYIYQ
ncbi:hypothetical protein E4T91_05415 [Ligilactobacillus murinus]|uniref:hypothetical protein n=1 Tax=Ligilactobacillus murinus TaxID=1622 RepID=UPI0010717F2E|nr:hypothetical protein [Ligilactobacillus murinus]MBF0758182.1 hypothetical protein [Ligilactobacillus murinus]MBF0831981.1 hypothetical protein [Ligilactobacillus murinus]TFU64372.1 hypothetical protein E4T91_05415 [Ligilactobacillus murinus]